MTSVTCAPAATATRPVSPLTCPPATWTSIRRPAAVAAGAAEAPFPAGELVVVADEPPAGAAAEPGPAQPARVRARAAATAGPRRAAGNRAGRTVTGGAPGSGGSAGAELAGDAGG